MTIQLIQKRPNELRRYEHDWSPFLGEDTIVDEVTESEDVLVNVDVAEDGKSVILNVSGGVNGTRAKITHTITTASGDEETELFFLDVGPEEPISLADMKQHLRVDIDDDDTYILSLIKAAREYCERTTDHILVQRQITKSFDYFKHVMELAYRPMVSVDEIKYIDSNGDEQLYEGARLNALTWPARIEPIMGEAWPSTWLFNPITITFTAGYDEGTVPETFIQAIKLLVGQWYESRVNTIVGAATNEMPLAVKALLHTHTLYGGVG